MQLLSKIRWPAIMAFVLGLAGLGLAQRFPPPPRPPRPGFRPPGQGGPPRGMPPGMPGMFPRHPMAPPADPEQVRAEIENKLATQPHEVFARLNTARGQVLAPAERLTLARQAVARLAARVEASNNRWATLEEVRTAVQNGGSFDPAIRDNLALLARLAERRALADTVFELHHLVERDSWRETLRCGQQWLKRLRGLDQWGLDKETLQTRRETQEALAGIVRGGVEHDALDTLQEGLRTSKLENVSVANLPPQLYDCVQGLRALKTVRELAGETRLNQREVAALKQHLGAFTKSLRNLSDADAMLGAKILQDLAVRHFLEGHTAEYRALMPVEGSADHAKQLLRNMKALALGKGEVATAPARQALSGKADDIPSGIRALLPEPVRKKWHSPQRSSVKVGRESADNSHRVQPDAASQN